MGFRKLSVLLAVGLCLGASLTTGCGRSTRGQSVAIDGIKLSQEHPTVVEVDNWNGSVTIRAIPGLKAPSVRAKVKAAGAEAPKVGKLWEGVSVKATSSISGTERLLKVVSTATDDPPSQVSVDIEVRVAAVAETRVRNAGGQVELVHVNGPISVENGYGGRPGGPVEVRTGEAMTFPVTISTTGGKVLYIVGPGSTGTFDIVADNGPARFTSLLGQVKDVHPEYNHYRCILSEGTNPVSLRSGNGPVRASVVENAGTIGPEIWDGTPVWPKEPRIVGRLGGYYNDEPARMPWQKPQKPAGATEPAVPPPGQ